ncbi:UNVERIFIED_CONTAM: hypothetical protein NCL1_31546 [Trichonephila clavipes]
MKYLQPVGYFWLRCKRCTTRNDYVIALVIARSNFCLRDNSFSISTLVSPSSSITVPNSTECG